MKNILKQLIVFLCVLTMALGVSVMVYAQDNEVTAEPEVTVNPGDEQDSGENKTISFSLEKTSYTFNGSAVTPAISDVYVTSGDQTIPLTADDYSVACDGNKAVGTASIIVYGKGAYEGYYGSAQFEITQADVASDCKLALKSTRLVYTGKAQTPAVAVTINGVTLKNGTDYTVSYKNNKAVGTAQVVVSGKGNFTGQVGKSFKIVKAAQPLKVTKTSYKIKVGKTAAIKAKGSKGKLSYSSSKPSVASVSKSGIIKGLKKGSATITVSAAATNSYLKATVKIKVKVEGEKLVKSSTKINLSSTSYTYDGKKKRPTVKKLTFKGKTLKKNTDYKVSYENNVNAGTAKVVIKGIKKYAGTVKFSFKIKKAANPISVSITSSQIDIKKTAAIKVKKAVGKVTYASENSSVASVNKNGIVTGKKRGECYITVTAAGDKNHDKAVVKFKVIIGKKDLSDKNTTVTLPKTAIVYDGTVKKPQIIVKYSGKQLVLNRDYTLVYTDNLNAGTARIYVKGKGDYEGTRIVTFTINKAPQEGISVYLKDFRIPYGGKAKVEVTGARGKITYGSYSPSYAKPLGDGWYQGLKKTQNYVTITVTAAGDANYKSKTFELKVHID